MTKKFVFVIILLFTAYGLSAQSDQKLHFGLKAAPSLAWLSSDTKEFVSDGTTLGFTYGLITEFTFSDSYAFATGIDVSYRGGSSKFSDKVFDTTRVVETDYTLQYIELPLTLKLKTNEIGHFTYFLQVGLSPGYNIRSRADAKTTKNINSYTTVTEEDDQDISESINNFNLAMIIGAGLEYTLSGNTVLLTGITFNNGFLDIIDSENIKANSNYLALTLGVLF
jgi:opacity protein-like surface antigen